MYTGSPCVTDDALTSFQSSLTYGCGCSSRHTKWLVVFIHSWNTFGDVHRDLRILRVSNECYTVAAGAPKPIRLLRHYDTINMLMAFSAGGAMVHSSIIFNQVNFYSHRLSNPELMALHSASWSKWLHRGGGRSLEQLRPVTITVTGQKKIIGLYSIFCNRVYPIALL